MTDETDKTSWRDAVRARTAPRAQSVAVLAGWRRFLRPLGVVVVAAAAGAGAAVWMNGQETQPAANPAARASDSPGLVNARTVAVVATAKRGCVAEPGPYSAGRLVVSVTNKDAIGLGTVSLRSSGEVLAERESIPPGATGSFTVTIPAGRYTLVCPGTNVDQTVITVSGNSGDAPVAIGSELKTLLQQASTSYGRYISDQAAGFTRANEDLAAALSDNSQRPALLAYCRAKVYLNRISSNPAVENALEANGLEVEDQLEEMQKGLFKDKSVRSLAGDADKIVANARRFETLVGGIAFDPNNIGLGALESLNGVFRGEIMGQEEEWSGYDLLDVAARVSGSKAAFQALRPALTKVDAQFTTKLDAAFARLDATIASFRRSNELGGYQHYDDLTPVQLKNISHDVQAVVEPVSRMAMKVVSA